MLCVETLLAPRVDDVTQADTAIFYSINNAQSGLAGVSFGNFLIKRVVADLAKDFRRLKTFATLSPIPGFMGWLREQARPGNLILLPAEEDALSKAIPTFVGVQSLLQAIAEPKWHRDTRLEPSASSPLLRFCAQYLTGMNEQNGRAVDRPPGERSSRMGKESPFLNAQLP